MVSIKDVARHAGVAISTVSKVLNHYPNVSEETKKKVNEAVEELNFLPNSVAAALSSKQAGRMALLVNLNTRTQAIDEIDMRYISGAINKAAELGLDTTTARRAGLLHDIGKALTHEIEGSHVAIGVDLARKYKESPEVIHAIEAHHGDVECKTLMACLVQAADAVSAARPGARRENLENYIKRLEALEEITSSFNGVEKSFAIQAGREIRIMVEPDKVTEDQMVILARDLAKKIESELEYPGQIKVHVIRETKVVEYAK